MHTYSVCVCDKLHLHHPHECLYFLVGLLSASRPCNWLSRFPDLSLQPCLEVQRKGAFSAP